MTPGGPATAVVLVCHDNAAEIADTLASVLDQLRDGDEVVVVDNASRDGTADAARRAAPSATVIEAGANLGFAGGCHAGADATAAPLMFFLNPDATLAPGCLDALRGRALASPGWGAWQTLVVMPDDRVNTAGNVVHFLGFGWAGGLDDAVSAVDPEPREVGFPSGAALAVRREAWDALGGFDRRYFMYGEDLDLGLRLRLGGWRVGIEPRARVIHDYSFTKGDYKWFYLERNRWWTVAGVYPGSLLALLLPALLAFEVALLVASWRGGWLRPKLRADAAVLRELPQILARRRQVQAASRIGAREFAAGLTASLDSPQLPTSPALERVLTWFFAAVRAVLR